MDPDPNLGDPKTYTVDPTDPDVHADPDPQHCLQYSYLAMPHFHFFTVRFSFLYKF